MSCSIVAGSKSINIAVNKWSCLSWCPPKKSTTVVEYVVLFCCCGVFCTGVCERLADRSTPFSSWRMSSRSCSLYQGKLVQPFPSSCPVSLQLKRESVCAPAIQRTLCDETCRYSLQGLAENCDLPLDHVVRLVSHLVQWKRASVIQPLTESNVYMLTDRADVSR